MTKHALNLMVQLLIVLTTASCIDKNVRLYVEVDNSCKSCCNNLLFKVNLDDLYYGAATVDHRLLVEQPIGTTSEIAVFLAEDESRKNHPEKCAQCINASINNSLWRTELPSDKNYAYYNRLLLFENEDIHINITCNPFPKEDWDSCGDISCWTPPQDQCIASTSSSSLPSVFNTMMKHSPRGVCTDGECRYPSVEVTCSTGYCDFNGCISRPSCEDVYCINPPPNRCIDPSTVIQFSATGYCNSGQCYYPKQEIVCESGMCQDGHCIEEPCVGVFCHKPPAPYCMDNSTLRVFETVGRCEADGATPQCIYTERDITCPYGCFQGACLATPCMGSPCDHPPASYCENKNLIVFDPLGHCDSGYCHYPFHTIECGTCEEGKCEDACLGVTCNKPLAAYCTGNTTLHIFDAKGRCQEGNCIYSSTEIKCDGRCFKGQCKEDPCAGVVCIPPAARCDHENVEFGAEDSGDCVDGSCEWELENRSCPDGCSSGACITHPCTGVSCITPPADHCIDDTTLIKYESEGSCSGSGTCKYDSERILCNVCEEGRCVS